MNKTIKIEISHKTIIFTFVFFFLLRFLWSLRDLIFSLLIAFIIMSALKPVINFFLKLKIPRVVAAVLAYLIFLFSFIYLLIFIIPSFVSQIAQFIFVLPEIFSSLSPEIKNLVNFNSLFQYLPNITNNLIRTVSNLFSNVVFIVSTLFFGFYFLLEEDLIKTTLIRFFDEKKAEEVALIFSRIEKKLGNWCWGEIKLMILVGLLNYLGFLLIGLKYALPLAIIAGFLEVIPNLGPTIAAFPAVLIGFSQSPLIGLSAIAVAFIVQQLENNVVVPLIMKKATGFNPIVILIALIVGGRVGGVLGVLLALPILIIIESVFQDLIKK